MDKIDFNKFISLLNDKWKGSKQCPICQNNSWDMSENLTELREFHHGTLIVGGKIHPLIVLTCNVCGYTLLFNAIIAGLIEPKKTDATPSVKIVKSEIKRIKENEP